MVQTHLHVGQEVPRPTCWPPYCVCGHHWGLGVAPRLRASSWGTTSQWVTTLSHQRHVSWGTADTWGCWMELSTDERPHRPHPAPRRGSGEWGSLAGLWWPVGPLTPLVLLLPGPPERQELQKYQPGASLVAQWLRICLPMQGTRVRALVWEDPTCCGATGPVSHNY